MHRNGLSAPLGPRGGTWAMMCFHLAKCLLVVGSVPPCSASGCWRSLLLCDPCGQTHHGGKPNAREGKRLLQELPATCRMFLRVVTLSGPSSARGRCACSLGFSSKLCPGTVPFSVLAVPYQLYFQEKLLICNAIS